MVNIKGAIIGIAIAGVIAYAVSKFVTKDDKPLLASITGIGIALVTVLVYFWVTKKVANKVGVSGTPEIKV